MNSFPYHTTPTYLLKEKCNTMVESLEELHEAVWWHLETRWQPSSFLVDDGAPQLSDSKVWAKDKKKMVMVDWHYQIGKI